VLPRENGSVVLTLGSAKLDPAEPFPVERSSGATRPERAPLSQVQVRPKPRTHAVVLVPALAPALAPPRRWTVSTLQPFSQKSLTATVPKVFQIGLCGVVEADLELFCNSWSAGFLGERL